MSHFPLSLHIFHAVFNTDKYDSTSRSSRPGHSLVSYVHYASPRCRGYVDIHGVVLRLTCIFSVEFIGIARVAGQPLAQDQMQGWSALSM